VSTAFPGPDSGADLLVVGGDVVTMDADRRVRLGATIAIAGGTIVAIGATESIRARFPGTTELDATGDVVIPGLIDAHFHSTVSPLVRSLVPDNIPGQESIYRWTVPLHEVADGDDDELAATISGLDALSRGVTTLLDPGTVSYPLRAAAGLRATGIRARVGGWGWDDLAMPFSGPVDEVLAAQEETVRTLNGTGPGSGPDGLVTGWVTLVGHGLASDALFTGALELAEKLDTTVTWHISPGPEDLATYTERHGTRPVLHLERIGALGPRLLLGHAVWIDDAEIDALIASATAVAACPAAYLRLGQQVTRSGRHVEFLRRGGRLALGCDSHNGGDVPDVLRAAWLLTALERDHGDADPLRAAEAFAVATVGGAEAIGAPTGTLQVGHPADLVVLDTTRPGWIPRGDLAQQLVWGAAADTVRDVVVAGRVVVRDRQVTTVDVGAVRAAAAERSAALLRRSGIPVTPSWPQASWPQASWPQVSAREGR
jgi:5-methylthioadenosine/S-adenosylhomocysteine deaminase